MEEEKEFYKNRIIEMAKEQEDIKQLSFIYGLLSEMNKIKVEKVERN